MNTQFLVIFLIICLSKVNCEENYPTNICVDAQKFKFDGLQVNSIFQAERSFTFNRIQDLIINDDKGEFEFDDWECPINKTMAEEDKELYNNHLIKIYSESFFETNLVNFYNHRKYIKNILESFIETKKVAEDFEDSLNCKMYAQKLTDLIERVRNGYKFIKCLTKIKENKLCKETFSIYALEEKIRGIILDKETEFLSFRNKPLSYYYNQPLIKSTFQIKRRSERFLSLDSTAILRISLFIPLHLKNYDSKSRCIGLDELPEFYQSV